MGPVTGRLTEFSKDTTNPQQMLTADPTGGLYRSADGGSDWLPVTQGLTTAAGFVALSINTVRFVPGVASVALLATNGGIYRSSDGGQSWTGVYTKNSSQFIFVGSTIYAASSAGVLVSADAGLTWTVSLGAGSVEAMDTAGGAIFAALRSNGHDQLYQLVAGAWNNVNTQLPAGACQLAIDPNTPTTIYASLAGGYNCYLYASMDGGVTFNQVNNPALGTQAVVFSNAYPHRVYVAGDGKTNWTIADGNTSPTYSSVGIGADTREIIVEPSATAGEDRCYVGSDQGLYVLDPCSNGTGKMTAMTNVSQVSAGWITGLAVSNDGQNMIAMVQDYSAKASNDAGKTWHSLPIGEDGTAAFSPTNPLSCYGFNGGLYVSTDGCKTVKKVTTSGGTTYQSSVIAFDPVTPTTMYVVAGTAINQSTDGGNTFSNTSWPVTAPYLVVVDPQDGKHIMVGDGNTISVSVDGGVTWTPATGLAATGNYRIAFHPSDKNTIVAAVYTGSSTSVYRSTDRGMTFTKISTVAAGVWSLAFNTAGSPPYLALTGGRGNGGLWLSMDLGTTWQRQGGGSLLTNSVIAAQWVNGVLYFSTYGEGILKSNIPLQ